MLFFALYYFFEPQNREIMQRVFSEIYFFLDRRVLVFFLIADLVFADGGKGDQSNIPELELALTRSSQSHHESYGTGARFEGSYEV